MDNTSSSGISLPTLIGLIYAITSMIGLYKLFDKAGYPGWRALIPVLNTMTMAKIALGRAILGLLIFVPVVGWVATLIISYQFIRQFNVDKSVAFVSIFFPPIIYALVGFGAYEYVGDMYINEDEDW